MQLLVSLSGWFLISRLILGKIDLSTNLFELEKIMSDIFTQPENFILILNWN